MPRYKACNAQAMYEYIDVLDKQIINISPHLAIAFRQSAYHELVSAPRLEAKNSSAGIFEAEIVYKILREAKKNHFCPQSACRSGL